MPNRIIKDSIHDSETVNRMTDFQFRLWVNLITYVDDYGRGDARPAIIKGKCFPLRERLSNADIKKALQALAGIGCISLYEVDGRSYLCFPTWESHQNIRSKKSRFPGPASNCNQLQASASNCNQLQASASNCNQLQANVPENPNPNTNPSSLLPRARAHAREDDGTTHRDIRCEKCGRTITDGVAAYSRDKFGKLLCQGCQAKTPRASSGKLPANYGGEKPDPAVVRKAYEELKAEEG